MMSHVFLSGQFLSFSKSYQPSVVSLSQIGTNVVGSDVCLNEGAGGRVERTMPSPDALGSAARSRELFG